MHVAHERRLYLCIIHTEHHALTCFSDDDDDDSDGAVRTVGAC